MTEEFSTPRGLDHFSGEDLLKIRKINSAREPLRNCSFNKKNSIILPSKNKKLFPADFFQNDPKSSAEGASSLEKHINIQSDRQPQSQNVENVRKAGKKLSVKEKTPDGFPTLKVILEEDEEKLRNSTKINFFRKSQIEIAERPCVTMQAEKEVSLTGNKFSSGWDNAIFFPPVIDDSDCSIKQELSSFSRDKFSENSSDLTRYTSQKLQTTSSNETSSNSCNAKQKLQKMKSLKVNINMAENIFTPKKDFIYTPKEDNSNFSLKSQVFFSEQFQEQSPCLTTNTQNQFSSVPIIDERLKSENNRNRPKSVLFSPKTKAETARKLNFGEGKGLAQDLNNKTPILRADSLRRIPKVKLPSIVNTCQINKELNEVLVDYEGCDEDPLIEKKLKSIIKNIKEIKQVIKTKSAKQLVNSGSKPGLVFQKVRPAEVKPKQQIQFKAVTVLPQRESSKGVRQPVKLGNINQKIK